MIDHKKVILICGSGFIGAGLIAMAHDHAIEIVIADDIQPTVPADIQIVSRSIIEDLSLDLSALIERVHEQIQDYTILSTIKRKVLNKSLPACRKLWLLNMQIDLKSYRAEHSPPFESHLTVKFNSFIKRVDCITNFTDTTKSHVVKYVAFFITFASMMNVIHNKETKPAYTKKQKKLIRFVLNDLLSNVRGFLYTNPKEIGTYSSFIIDDKNKEEIIRKYENTTILTKPKTTINKKQA